MKFWDECVKKHAFEMSVVYKLVGSYQHFKRTCCFHFQVISTVRMEATSSSETCVTISKATQRRYYLRSSVSVWDGIIVGIFFSSCLLSDSVTNQRYRHFLETVLPRLLEGVSLAVKQSFWFLHDWAPLHYGEGVWEWLNATYTRKCTWRRRSIAWPSWQSDLTLEDFFLWEPLKKDIHEVPPKTIENVVEKFQAVLRKVDSNILRRVRWNAVRLRVVCLETEGDHPWTDHLSAVAIWWWCVFSKHHRPTCTIFYTFS